MISGTREWAVAEINCAVVCPHDCRYCYARVAALKKGLIDSASDWSRVRTIDAEVETSRPYYEGQVMFPAAHDIVEDNLEKALQVVSRLLEAGNRVLIVSKPSRYCIEEICDRFSGRREKILFRFTITGRNSAILGFWEPGAPAYQERLESLQVAFERGFQTSVSIEPMLDLEDLAGMIDEIEPYVSHSIWVGKLNRIEERVSVNSTEAAAEVERIRHEQSDREIIGLYERLKDRPLVRWKESIKLVVGLPLATKSGLDT
jgi:DNA repair photolyase